MARILYHAEFAGCPPPALLARLEKATAALVDHAADPTQPSRRLFAGVNASLQRGRPADGGFGVLALREHIHARHAQCGSDFHELRQGEWRRRRQQWWLAFINSHTILPLRQDSVS